MELRKPTGAFLQSLVGNPEVYAVQNADGSWSPVRKKLTPGIIAKHLRGEVTVGTYIVKPPDLARTLVFDVDAPDHEEATAMLKQLTDVLIDINRKRDGDTLTWTVEFSGKKGWHVWIQAADYMPATTLYQLGRGIREEAGLLKLEVFPKQTTVRDLGNLVKLPGGVHRVSGKRNDLLTAQAEPNSIALLTELAGLYPEVAARMKRSETQAVEYPCVFALQDGVGEGSRNIGLFHLATMLRKFSIADEHVEAIVRAANARCEPPLEEDELQTIIANSAFSGPTCDQLTPDYHCGGQCIKARHPGLFTRSGALRYAADGEAVVVEVAERTEEGTVVELAHPDMVQGRAILAEPKRRKRDDE